MIRLPMTSIPPAVQSVLDLFTGPLQGVRFADIDAAGLANLAAEVEAAAEEVERQEATLTELRQALAQRNEALLGLAQQALSYARVYAENDEPLLEQLNRIALPRPAKPRTAKPRNASARTAPSREAPGPGNEAPLLAGGEAADDGGESDGAERAASAEPAVSSEAVSSEAVSSEAVSSEAVPRRRSAKPRGATQSAAS